MPDAMMWNLPCAARNETTGVKDERLRLVVSITAREGRALDRGRDRRSEALSVVARAALNHRSAHRPSVVRRR